MSNSKNLIFFLLYTGTWISTILLYLIPYFKSVYFLFYEAILIYFIYISRKNKLAFLLALSSFLYFYQVPLMDFFPHEKLGVYDFKLNIDIQFEAYTIYNTVLGCLYIILYYIIRYINFQKMVDSLNNRFFLNYLFYSGMILSLVLLGYTLIDIGGLNNYLFLNKFEASEAQKLFLFTYKDFASFTLVIGFLSKNKKIVYLTYILSILFIGFEILSAKRMMILIVFSNILLFKIKKIKVKYFFYILILLFLITLTKFIYYNIRLYVLGEGTFFDIFWFNWLDVLYDTIFMHETRGHIELLINYLYHNLDFNFEYFIKQLIVSFPFGHQLIDNYMTAGEFLKVFLHEPWMGLASSQYIVPYLSIGLFGILIVYGLQLLILFSFNSFIKEKNYIYLKILFFANIPIILFYSHREEIIIIIKNLIISSSVLLIIYSLAIMLRLIYKK